ncbi:MAG: adenylate/guanylate cyclase domain-containing protein [Alphaproteobacteria bacterium]|nr:adenylate/guanylate cyclase domain-containing protein [Alphaproteobacteria bacterium]
MVQLAESRFVPGAVHRAPAALHRPLAIAYVVSLLASALVTFAVVASVLNVTETDSQETLRLYAVMLGTDLALAYGSLLFILVGWFGLARVCVMLFAGAVLVSVKAAIGSSSGVDLVGATAIVALPALIYGLEERRQMFAAYMLSGAVVACIFWSLFTEPQPMIPVSAIEALLNRIFAVVVSVIVGGFIVYLHRTAEAAKQALAHEKARSDELLLSILPAETAERLKAGEVVIADSAEDVTVLFADIVGFTAYSADRSAEEVVSMLNRVFSGFDELAAACGVEKIKTIGDGYMAVGGLPEPRPDHARRVALMALGMIEVLRMLRTQHGVAIDVRIGMHCGRAVAGVIGRRKFSYDVWGDTVNTASRMESTGAPGRINVSRAVAMHLAGEFALEPRGRLAVKGKGELECYFLLGPKPQAASAA